MSNRQPLLFRKVAKTLTLLLTLASSQAWSQTQETTKTATITTNLGTITVELYESTAPITVANFVEYAKSGFYNNTIFHRVIPGFMVQGGGFDAQLRRKATQAPIKNEASPKLRNLIGTLAMARTSAPDSATSQFFINVADNQFLDRTLANPGYAVFGKVIAGMASVYQIADKPTGPSQGMQNVPIEPITIEKVIVETKPTPPPLAKPVASP